MDVDSLTQPQKLGLAAYAAAQILFLYGPLFCFLIYNTVCFLYREKYYRQKPLLFFYVVSYLAILVKLIDLLNWIRFFFSVKNDDTCTIT